MTQSPYDSLVLAGGDPQEIIDNMADAATYYDKIIGKHHLKGLDKPCELAMSLGK